MRPKVENSRWFDYNDSDSVLVFVHGILSASDSAWLFKDKKNGQESYWPKLIASDRRFRNPSIFLAGYDTSIDSGAYGFRDCANQVRNALRVADTDGHPIVMEKPRITFVCHSLGGIVVRYLLESNYADFARKRVGLVLIASPSYGSQLPNNIRTLDLLIQSYRNKLADQLRWGSDALTDLDDRFRELRDQKRIPELYGTEFCENWFILHSKWLPVFTSKIVVPKESARTSVTALMCL